MRENRGMERGYIDSCKEGNVFLCGIHELYPCKEELMYLELHVIQKTIVFYFTAGDIQQKIENTFILIGLGDNRS